MIIFCETCMQLYGENMFYKSRNGYKPPYGWSVGYCKKCKQEVVEVDELIASTILELNKKGYKTAFCCSGHLPDALNDCYIMFHNIPNKTLPKQFYLDGDCIRLRKESVFKYEDTFFNLLWIHEKLYLWASSLPYNS